MGLWPHTESGVDGSAQGGECVYTCLRVPASGPIGRTRHIKQRPQPSLAPARPSALLGRGGWGGDGCDADSQAFRVPDAPGPVPGTSPYRKPKPQNAPSGDSGKGRPGGDTVNSVSPQGRAKGGPNCQIHTVLCQQGAPLLCHLPSPRGNPAWGHREAAADPEREGTGEDLRVLSRCRPGYITPVDLSVPQWHLARIQGPGSARTHRLQEDAPSWPCRMQRTHSALVTGNVGLHGGGGDDSYI
ncbi:hypothetical protein H920_07397 [Fukomys damarensis]|uniref:Uncharacterized protein n=1 Tax=Fukomys damarensis TaxID=885580 RepID=A0A091E7W4_FUKDA|nr:hypothetical protein H920_07397 [Fukomys damarensis]